MKPNILNSKTRVVLRGRQRLQFLRATKRPKTIEQSLKKLYDSFIDGFMDEKVAEVRRIIKGGRSGLKFSSNFLPKDSSYFDRWVNYFLLWNGKKMDATVDFYKNNGDFNDFIFNNQVDDGIIEDFKGRNIDLLNEYGYSIRGINATDLVDEAIIGGGLVAFIKGLVGRAVAKIGISTQPSFWAADQVGKFDNEVTGYKAKNNGIPNYIWRATLDGKARPSHIARHGTIRDMDDYPKPGDEPHCRCDMILPLDGQGWSDAEVRQDLEAAGVDLANVENT